MKKILFLFLFSSLCAYFILSCGDGTISPAGGDDDLALLNYGEFNPEGMTGLISGAMDSCLADPNCAAVLNTIKDNATDSTKDTNSIATDTTNKTDTLNVDTNKTNKIISSSSTNNIVSSSTNETQSSSSNITISASTSSNSSTVNFTADDIDVNGTCIVTTTNVNKGSSGTITFTKTTPTKPSDVEYKVFYAALTEYNSQFTTFDCNLKIGDETVTQPCGTGVLTHTFTTKGSFDVSVTIKEKEFTCGKINVLGAAITNCVCKPNEYKPDVVSGSATVTWTVSSCNTDANIIGYTWSGVSGSNETATYEFTEKNEKVKPSVVVKNDDGVEKEFVCDSSKAFNSDEIEEELVWQQNKILTPGSYKMLSCGGSTGSKTVQISPYQDSNNSYSTPTSDQCKAWFGHSGWINNSPWSACNGQFNMTFPFVVDVPEGYALKLSNCW